MKWCQLVKRYKHCANAPQICVVRTLSCCTVYTVFHRNISPGRLAECQTYVSHSGGDNIKPQPTEKCDVFLLLRIVIWISSFTSGTNRFWTNAQLLFQIRQTLTLAVTDSNLFQFATRQLILAMAIHLPLTMYPGHSTGTVSRPSRNRILNYLLGKKKSPEYFVMHSFCRYLYINCFISIRTL